MYDHAETCTNDTESRIISDDLAALEQRKLSVLPTQRRKIYTMSRFEDKSITDISSELNLHTVRWKTTCVSDGMRSVNISDNVYNKYSVLNENV